MKTKTKFRNKNKKTKKYRKRMIMRGGVDWRITPHGEIFLFKLLTLAPSVPHRFRYLRTLLPEVMKILSKRAFTFVDAYTDVYGFSYRYTENFHEDRLSDIVSTYRPDLKDDSIPPPQRTESVLDICICFQPFNELRPRLDYMKNYESITEGFHAELHLIKKLKKMLLDFDKYIKYDELIEIDYSVSRIGIKKYDFNGLEILLNFKNPGSHEEVVFQPKAPSLFDKVREKRRNYDDELQQATAAANAIYPERRLNPALNGPPTLDLQTGEWYVHIAPYITEITTMLDGIKHQVSLLKLLKTVIPNILTVYEAEQFDSNEYKRLPIQLIIDKGKDAFLKSLKEFERRIDTAIAGKESVLDINSTTKITKDTIERMHKSKPPIRLLNRYRPDRRPDQFDKTKVADDISLGIAIDNTTSQLTPKDRKFLLASQVSGMQTLLRKRLGIEPDEPLPPPQPQEQQQQQQQQPVQELQMEEVD